VYPGGYETVERVSSVWLLIGGILFPIGVILAPVDWRIHVALSFIGGFTLFCLAVVLPLYSSIAGGRPRPLYEWGLALSTYILTLTSIPATVFKPSILPVSLASSMASGLVFTLLQLRSSRVPFNRVYSIPIPLAIGLYIILYWSLHGGGLTRLYIMLGLWFAPSIVMVVGAVFLGSLYRGRTVGITLHYLSIILIIVGLVSYTMAGRLPGLLCTLFGFTLHIYHLSPWSGGGGVRLRANVGHLSQAIGLGLTLTALLVNVDDVTLTHVVLLGFVAPGVYTQAPILAPALVSSTWRRRRWKGVSAVTMVLSSLLRILQPLYSLILVILSYLILLYELNPSPRRLYYIIRYGTEEGYLKSYHDGLRT